jgi:hypothetical protein
MPNKNDKSDLVQFFGVAAALIFGLGWLLSYGFALAKKEYGDDLEKMDARITNYVCQKWSQARE